MKKATRALITKRLNQKLDKFLAKNQPIFIIVTGSVGKTSTKIAIGKMLSARYKVAYSQDSYNFDISLPLSIFGLKVPARLWDMVAWRKIFRQIDSLIADFPYEVVVLEIAEDERAKMEPIVAKLHPKYAVLTEVSEVHMARMENVETVLRDVWAIGQIAQQVIYNADNKYLSAKATNEKSFVGFGLEKGEVRAVDMARQPDYSLSGKIKLGSKTVRFNSSIIAQHNLYSWLAAVAVARKLGLTDSQITAGLKNAKSTPGRMNLLQGKNGASLIDDSYNASPKAVSAALATLDSINASGQKIAVLGSMNELGDTSASAHEQIGRQAAKVADLLVTVGNQSGKYLASSAIDAGLDKEKVKIFRTPYEAGHYLEKLISPGDIVLIKGSQDGVYSEEVTRILLAEDIDPTSNLVRQSASWQRKKKRSFAL